MQVTEIELNNFRSFASASVKLSKGINLIIGPNNSGKSTLLKSLAWLQQGSDVNVSDIRILQNKGFVQIKLANDRNLQVFKGIKSTYPSKVEDSTDRNNFSLMHCKKNELLVKATLYNGINNIVVDGLNFSPPENNNDIFNKSVRFTIKNSVYSISIPNREPNNFIYPYFSKRKVVSYQETINLDHTSSVTGDLINLYAKIDRLSNPQMPAHPQYIEACKDILGFQITAVSSPAGKKAAYVVNNFESIPLEVMGEGIANLVGLIVDLCVAENKLFLIEEPENDVHPKALKKLLNLIVEKSKTNQFIITTHSNIVVKYLGAQPDSKLFQVTMDFEERIPTSKVEEVDDSPEARLKVLEELGYEFFDFEMWKAWLILEESSAEKIINYLIRWFTPGLVGKLRTYSARSLSEVEIKFEAFNNLFVFLHLQPIYKNLAWVIIDEGDNEKEVIERLKNRYTASGWQTEQFLQFSEHDFERYYPQSFQAQVDAILEMSNKEKKRKAKKELLDKVEEWIESNPESAKEAFKDSASDVIEILRQIESNISLAK